MKDIIIIIDFDNFFGSDTLSLDSEKLELAFSELLEICEVEFGDFNYVSIRLYGGWHYEMALTKQASVLQQLLYDVNVFPKIKEQKIIQGSIDIISSLYSIPEFTWGYTHKERNGMNPVRINFETIDEACNSYRSICPKFILYKFTKNKDKTCAVEDCNNIHKDTFKGIEQKMVDTLIACDIISIAENDTSTGLFIISDDQDHFPSIALAQQKQNSNLTNPKKILLGIRNERVYDFCTNFLSTFNIRTRKLL